jgi:hypothetical protein
MKHCTPLIVAALLASLFVGCSKRPASSASFVIEPGVSIGPVHSGMTIQQMVAGLGEPNRTNDSVLEYLNLGFEVVPDKEGVVETVMCVKKAGPFTTAFGGHTKEGIGIGSSRADVINAYGEPTATGPIDGEPGLGVLKYRKLGLVFGIGDGKVFRILVSFKSVP